MLGRAHRRRGLTALVGIALVAGSVLVGTSSPALAATAITVNGTSGGRALDGIGAVSGGGGNSRLLIDYPEHVLVVQGSKHGGRLPNYVEIWFRN